ncbi:MAG: alpha/beta fold hydrolase [Sphingobium sp.]|nr:alpha/beta fold hydrolase [Sphingobium sp.]
MPRNAITRFFLLALPLLATGGCADLAREQIYKANPAPINVAQWTRAAPADLSVTTEDGLVLKGYVWPGAADDRDILIFFHGRGSHQGVGARYAEYLTGRGDHVIVASYRGFGGNPGSPSQAGLICDGRAFVARARAMGGPDARVILVGHSLGGAVALHVAATVPVEGVVTLSTFDRFAESAPAYAAALLPDAWNNMDAATKIHAPLVMIHGTADERVDQRQTDALLGAARPPAMLITVAGERHNPRMDMVAPIVSEAVAAIDAGNVAHFPASLPTGWSVRRK